MIDSPNIFESPDRNDRSHPRGIFIVDRGPLALPQGGRVCVSGTIKYMGCETGPAICTDAAFDYGIVIDRVMRGRSTR